MEREFDLLPRPALTEALLISRSAVEIGVGLTAFGLFFMLMGVMMFFDGGLLAIGNVSQPGGSYYPNDYKQMIKDEQGSMAMRQHVLAKETGWSDKGCTE